MSKHIIVSEKYKSPILNYLMNSHVTTLHKLFLQFGTIMMLVLWIEATYVEATIKELI